jgi:hypothetical protein
MSANLQDCVVVSVQLKMDSMYRIDANPVDSHIFDLDDLDLKGRMVQIAAQELECSNEL